MFSVGQKVAAKTNLKDSPFSVQKGSKGVVIAKLHDLMVVSFLCDGSNVLLPVHATDLSLDPPTTNKPTFPAKTENAFGNLQLSYDPEEDHRLAKTLKFLGAASDESGKEVHVFQKEPFETCQNRSKTAQPLASIKPCPNLTSAQNNLPDPLKTYWDALLTYGDTMPDYPSKDGAVRKPSELKEGQPLQVVFHGNNGIDDKGVHTVTGKALTTYEDSVYGYRPHRIWTVRDESGKNHLLADKDDMSFHQSVLSIVEIPIKELIDVQNECGRCPTCGIRKVRQPDDIQSGHVEYETETLCGNSTCSDECWESWTFCPYCGKPFEGKGK